jgi:phosphoribosyl 1,2-cyclic phosphodiesterase
MEITIIASGSTGNCYKVSDGETSVLIDAGIPLRAIQIKLNFRLDDISGALISHCHKDHCISVKDLAKYGIDVYSSRATLLACGADGHRAKAISALNPITIGTFKIMPFEIQHDAPDPLGFLIESTLTGDKLLYFTDSFYIKYRFSGLTHVMCECNYDKASLDESVRTGRISRLLAPRIIKSHMSLEHLLELLKANDLSRVKQIYLMHLSDNNSNEALMKSEVQKLTGTEVYVC